jgi:hypothetical protein
MPLNENDPLAITLTAAEWNQVLGLLQEGPYRIAAPLIAKIHKQGQAAGGEVLDHEPATNGTGQPLNPPGETAHVPDR